MSRRASLVALALGTSFVLSVAVSNGPANAFGQAKPGRGKCVGVVVGPAPTPAVGVRSVYLYRAFEDGSVDFIKHAVNEDDVDKWLPVPAK